MITSVSSYVVGQVVATFLLSIGASILLITDVTVAMAIKANRIAKVAHSQLERGKKQ